MKQQRHARMHVTHARPPRTHERHARTHACPRHAHTHARTHTPVATLACTHAHATSGRTCARHACTHEHPRHACMLAAYTRMAQQASQQQVARGVAANSVAGAADGAKDVLCVCDSARHVRAVWWAAACSGRLLLLCSVWVAWSWGCVCMSSGRLCEWFACVRGCVVCGVRWCEWLCVV